METGLLSRTLPIGTKGADRSTQARRAVPLYLKSKSKRILVSHVIPRMKERKEPGQPGVNSSFLLEGQLWCGGEFDGSVGFVERDDAALEWAIVFEGNADLLAADEGGGLDGFG